jgi:hypothetical protein
LALSLSVVGPVNRVILKSFVFAASITFLTALSAIDMMLIGADLSNGQKSGASLIGSGVELTTGEGSTTLDGVGVGVGLTATFFTTDFLATGFLAIDLAAGFLTAEKEVAGNRSDKDRAKTMYFFMMPFSRFRATQLTFSTLINIPSVPSSKAVTLHPSI